MRGKDVARAKRLLESKGMIVFRESKISEIKKPYKVPTFEEWLANTFYPGFDPSGLSDEEYAELEDQYYAEIKDLQESKSLSDQEIKELMSKHLNLRDKAAEYTLRKILFDPANKIDWQKAYQIAQEQMPELLKESSNPLWSDWHQESGTGFTCKDLNIADLSAVIYPPGEYDGMDYDTYNVIIYDQSKSGAPDDDAFVDSADFPTEDEAKAWAEKRVQGTKKPNRQVREGIGDLPHGDDVYYLIQIDKSTNMPGQHYATSNQPKGQEILRNAGISDSDIEIDQLGYDDITFIIHNKDKVQVNRLAHKIASVAEPYSKEYCMEFDVPEGETVSVSGPYYDDEFTAVDDTDFWGM